MLKQGDIIVSTEYTAEDWTRRICTIDGFHKDLVITRSGNDVIHHDISKIRPATREEIRENRRLHA